MHVRPLEVKSFGCAMRVRITVYPVVYQVLMCFWAASETPLMGSIRNFSTNRQNLHLEFC